MKLSPQEQVRYMRQLMLPEIGTEGQLRLKQSSVLVIGAGGLGSPAIYYLASAGVGHIGIADGDAVELSNLNRQILHASTRIGKNKACSAAETIQEWNPAIIPAIFKVGPLAYPPTPTAACGLKSLMILRANS